MNATVVTVWLDSWGDGGCGILYFVIEYKESKKPNWIMASNSVKPTERVFSITELLPATEYLIRVTAYNNAGETAAVYNFTTLTLLGGKFTSIKCYTIYCLNPLLNSEVLQTNKISRKHIPNAIPSNKTKSMLHY